MLVGAGAIVAEKFEIRSAIGSGGMGVVYEAFQLGLDRLVALKMLTVTQPDQTEDVARFEREAAILNQLNHANIVQFYSYGSWGNMPYIAMELLHGTSLQQRLSSNSGLPLNEALSIMQQVSAAIGHAHANGVIHRDIKPSNILLVDTGDGAPIAKVIDFGLGMFTEASQRQKLTQTGIALGSCLYMSPEQCVGQPVNKGTDIYSLGCVLYHTVTGMPPFTADNGIALMFAQLNQAVSTTERWESLSPPLQQVVAKCMDKEPNQRYSCVAELADDLSRIINGICPQLEGHPADPNSKGIWTGHKSQPSRKSNSRKLQLVMLSAIIVASLITLMLLSSFQTHSLKYIGPADRLTNDGMYEVMTRIPSHEKRGLPIDYAQHHQLVQAVARCATEPSTDRAVLLRAYSCLIRFEQAKGNTNKARAIMSEAVARCHSPGATSERLYTLMVINYCAACMASNCGSTVTPLIESTLRDAPVVWTDERAILKAMLGHNLFEAGNIDEAERLFREARPYTVAEHKPTIDSMLAACARIRRERAAKYNRTPN